MKDSKLEVGDEFYDGRLNNLLICSDEYFNTIYSDEGFKQHLDNEIKYFVPYAGGCPKYTTKNDYKRFKVIYAQYENGGCGMGHYMGDVYTVKCYPVEDSSIIISFAQDTFGYYTNIENIEQVF